CGVIGIAISVLRLEARHVRWLLRQPPTAGFVELDRLPYAATLPSTSFASVLKWLRARRLDDTYTPIDDPLNPGTTISPIDVIAFALSAGAVAAATLDRLAIVTGWDKGTLSALDTYFGYSAAGVTQFADPVVIDALETTVVLLAKVGVTVTDGLL